MLFDLDIFTSVRMFILTLSRSSSKVKVINQSSWSWDNVPFRLRVHVTMCDVMDTRYVLVHFLVVCRILCAKLFGATSSEDFLIHGEHTVTCVFPVCQFFRRQRVREESVLIPQEAESDLQSF